MIYDRMFSPTWYLGVGTRFLSSLMFNLSAFNTYIYAHCARIGDVYTQQTFDRLY